MVVVMRLFENSAWPFEGSRAAAVLRAAAAVSACALVAGCSADVARFDFPAFGLTEGEQARPPSSYGGGSLLGDAGPAAAPAGGYAPAPRTTDRVETAALPRDDGYRRPPSSYGRRDEPVATYDPTPPRRTETRDYERRADYAPPSRETRYDAGSVTGNSNAGTITVERGDTLYGLSRRHGVSVESIMQANGMTNSMLRVGQTLVLPDGASRAVAASRPSRPSYAAPRPSYENSDTAEAPSGWNGTYEIEPGDSLYAVARRYGVRTSELQRYNGIENPRALRPGQILKVPNSASASTPRVASKAEPASEARSRIFSAPPEMAAPTTPLPGQPQILNGTTPKRVAALSPERPTVSDASPSTNQVRTVAITPPKIEAPEGTSKLRWPARGKIVSRFGPRPDGTHNDGVNIAVPEGADVLAADDGVVAYAGSELKGYGNLILIRHDNGWVTAYAHNAELLVKRGDTVKRGGVIAKAGRTGQVATPQVHFELRQGAKPVDPVPYLERI